MRFTQRAVHKAQHKRFMDWHGIVIECERLITTPPATVSNGIRGGAFDVSFWICELSNVLKGMLSEELNHHTLNWRIKISWHVNYFERHSRDTHWNSERFTSASEVEEHTLNNLMDEMSRSCTIHHSATPLSQGSGSMEWISRIFKQIMSNYDIFTYHRAVILLLLLLLCCFVLHLHTYTLFFFFFHSFK